MSKWSLKGIQGILLGGIFILATTGAATGLSCSNATLNSTYGLRQSGPAFFPNGTVQVDEIGEIQFDGAGHFSLDLFSLDNGVIAVNFAQVPGTYNLSSNCTGSAELDFPDGHKVELKVVLSKGGKIVHFLAFELIFPGNSTPVPVAVHGDGEKLDLD